VPRELSILPSPLAPLALLIGCQFPAAAFWQESVSAEQRGHSGLADPLRRGSACWSVRTEMQLNYRICLKAIQAIQPIQSHPTYPKMPSKWTKMDGLDGFGRLGRVGRLFRVLAISIAVCGAGQNDLSLGPLCTSLTTEVPPRGVLLSSCRQVVMESCYRSFPFQKHFKLLSFCHYVFCHFI